MVMGQGIQEQLAVRNLVCIIHERGIWRMRGKSALRHYWLCSILLVTGNTLLIKDNRVWYIATKGVMAAVEAVVILVKCSQGRLNPPIHYPFSTLYGA